MNRIIPVCFLLLLVFSGSLAAEKPYLRRFALIIGANDGGDSRVRLRYAGTDAQSISSVLTRLGGLEDKNMIFLNQPSVFEVLNAFLRMNVMITSSRGSSDRTELVFYYSGHSDESGLLLSGRTLPYKLLKQALGDINADVKLAFLDSCSSGTLVRLKGGTTASPFLHDTSMKMQGTAILTSSSHNEAAQESDMIRGSFFTHYVISGLRGAADSNADGRITLNELYQFAYHQTLATTERTTGGAQHPNYSIQLSGSGDVVVTDIRLSLARLVLDRNLGGSISVRRANGIFVAELRKPDGIETVLGLEPGQYSAVIQRGAKYYQTAFTIATGGSYTLYAHNMREVTDLQAGINKGEPQPMITAPARFSLALVAGSEPGSDFNGFGIGLVSANVGGNGSGLLLSLIYSDVQGFFSGIQMSLGYCGNAQDFAGYQASALWGVSNGRDFGGFQEGFLYAINGRDFSGFQCSVLYSGNERNFSGFQGAFGVAYNAAHFNGLQMALFYTRTAWLSGFQLGLVNSVREDLLGLQIGLLNAVGGNADGAQIGLVNIADDVAGAQISLVNIGRKVSGTQIGLVNVADDSTVPLGLLNFVKNGQFALQSWYDETGFANIGLLTGGRIFYTLLSFGQKIDDKDLDTFGFGIGLNIPLGHDLELKTDILCQLYADNESGDRLIENNGTTEVTRRLRLSLEYRPFRLFSVTVGVSINGNNNPDGRIMSGCTAGNIWRTDEYRIWPGYYIGINLF